MGEIGRLAFPGKAKTPALQEPRGGWRTGSRASGPGTIYIVPLRLQKLERQELQFERCKLREEACTRSDLCALDLGEALDAETFHREAREHGAIHHGGA